MMTLGKKVLPKSELLLSTTNYQHENEHRNPHFANDVRMSLPTFYSERSDQKSLSNWVSLRPAQPRVDEAWMFCAFMTSLFAIPHCQINSPFS
jgi:hypothetical protein